MAVRYGETKIKFSTNSIVLIIGCSGSGKSTFANKHFLSTEIVSADTIRGWISDDEGDQNASEDAFELLYNLTKTRLRFKKTVVVDNTNVREKYRRKFIEIAKAFKVPIIAVVVYESLETAITRNSQRKRQVPVDVIKDQYANLQTTVGTIDKEAFDEVYVLYPGQIEEAKFVNESYESLEEGPFDVISDVHGCYVELCELLEKLGYVYFQGSYSHPKGNKAIFVGDLTDRGPASDQVLTLVMSMVNSGNALNVMGNHDNKLLRYMKGNNIKIAHGLDMTINQLGGNVNQNLRPSEHLCRMIKEFFEKTPSHLVLDNGNLVVAHAGLKESFHGRTGKHVDAFCMYGDTTGTTDENGFPVRKDWASEYQGNAVVVHGHTVVDEVYVKNNVYNIDTGCVFGNCLTALRYPSMELVQVKAKETYAVHKSENN